MDQMAREIDELEALHRRALAGGTLDDRAAARIFEVLIRKRRRELQTAARKQESNART